MNRVLSKTRVPCEVTDYTLCLFCSWHYTTRASILGIKRLLRMFGVQWVIQGSWLILAELHCCSAAVAALSGAQGKRWCQFLLQTCQVMSQHDTYHLSSCLGLNARQWAGRRGSVQVRQLLAEHMLLQNKQACPSAQGSYYGLLSSTQQLFSVDP